MPKTRIPILIALLCLVFSAICVFQGLHAHAEYTYPGEFSFSEDTHAAGSYVLHSQISLPRGIYHVQVVSSTDTFATNVFSITELSEDGSPITDPSEPHRIYANDTVFYDGLSALDTTIWISATSDADISVTYSGSGTLSIGDITFSDNGQIWYCGALLLFIFSLITVSIPRITKFVPAFDLVLLLGIVALATIPVLQGGLLNTADTVYHLLRIESLKDGLLSGQFPVRIGPKWLQSYGYADPTFYPNLFLLPAAIMQMVGFTVTESYIGFIVFLNIMTVAIAYYSFAHLFADRAIAIGGTALYTLSIFRIYKLMITGAVGEGCAYAFLPLIIYGLFLILHRAEGPKSALPLSLGLSGVICSHILTTEITLMVAAIVFIGLLGYALYALAAHKDTVLFYRSVWTSLIRSAGITLVLTAWFTVPFLQSYLTEDLKIKHVATQTIQERGLYLTQLLMHFWQLGENAQLEGWGMLHSYPQGVGLILILPLVCFYILWRSHHLHAPWSGLGKICFSMSILLLCMSLKLFPWNAIQSSSSMLQHLVSAVQFPHRFLGWGTAFLVTLFCICLKSLSELTLQSDHFYSRNFLVHLGLLLIVISVFTSGMYLTHFFIRDGSPIYLYSEESMGFGFVSGGEYLVEGTDTGCLHYGQLFASEAVSVSDSSFGSLEVSITCSVQEDHAGFIDLPLLYYPGYRSSDEATSITIGDNNVVRLNLPAGYQGSVTVKWQEPVLWRIATVISILGLFALICSFGYLWIKKSAIKSPAL